MHISSRKPQRVSCLLFLSLICSAIFAAEPGLAEMIPGTWRGTHTAGNGGYQHIITVQKQGPGFVGRGITWFALSEDQALAASKGQRPRADNPKAFCVLQQFAIMLDGDTVTFKGVSVQNVFGTGKYLPDTFSGKWVAPGFVSGGAADLKNSGGIFHLWKEDALKKPAALDLATGKTLKMDCLDGGKYHYTCYIPKSYDPEKAAPVLINFSPGGDGQPFSTKMAEESGWIMAGLTESKNGPVEPSFENRDAVLFDLRRRFNVDMKHIFFSGFSGGARCASESSLQYPSICAGLILVGASYGGMPPPKEIPIFYITGETDMNRKEVEGAYATSQKLGRPASFILHPGGHAWGRDEDHDAAVRWMAKQTESKHPDPKKK